MVHHDLEEPSNEIWAPCTGNMYDHHVFIIGEISHFSITKLFTVKFQWVPLLHQHYPIPLLKESQAMMNVVVKLRTARTGVAYMAYYTT
jgi:hypothetical protein